MKKVSFGNKEYAEELQEVNVDKNFEEVVDENLNDGPVEPKEWSAEDFRKGAKEYIQDNGDFDYTEPDEVDWAARQAEYDAQVEEDFDRTYAGQKKTPFYKNWKFWVVCVLVVAVVAVVALWYNGYIFSYDPTSETVTTQTDTEELPTVEAKNLTLPEDAEVIQGSDGKWGVYQYGELLINYNGIAPNSLGTWYIVDGLVDFTFTGYINVNGTIYSVTDGKVDVNSATTNGTTATTEEETTVTYDDDVDATDDQEEALDDAEDYLDEMSYSRSWLIAQLESDGYDSYDAAWAVDHTSTNWNYQAYLKAREYLRLTSFTYDDMVAQLVFEGFSQEQAEYGASRAGLE